MLLLLFAACAVPRWVMAAKPPCQRECEDHFVACHEKKCCAGLDTSIAYQQCLNRLVDGNLNSNDCLAGCVLKEDKKDIVAAKASCPATTGATSSPKTASPKIDRSPSTAPLTRAPSPLQENSGDGDTPPLDAGIDTEQQTPDAGSLEAAGTALMVASAALAIGIIISPWLLNKNRRAAAAVMSAPAEDAPSPSAPRSSSNVGGSDPPSRDRNYPSSASDTHYAFLVQALATATSNGDHAAITEATSEIMRISTQRNSGRVGKLVGFTELLSRLSLPQRVTLAMEILDVGTDGSAYFSVVVLSGEGGCANLGPLVTGQLVIFAASLLLQVGRWLFLRRE